MTEPVIDYGQRAGARERPAIWVEPDHRLQILHTRDEGLLYAAIGQTLWVDISSYQIVVNSSYPYPVLGFRADTGGSTDSHAAANWAYCESHPDDIQVAIPYVVFKPGQRAAIMGRLKNLFGAHCPANLVPEIDMESGQDFAGPGDHSGEANALAADLAAWTGDQDRVQGYANSPDWSGSWPTRPSWMKRRLAWYSSSAYPPPAGFYAVQFYGALPYPSPPGLPRSCAPFGSYVDMNATPRTITQILADYGIGDAMAITDEDAAKVANAVFAKFGNVTNDRLGDVLHQNTDGLLTLVKNIEFGVVNYDDQDHASWSARGEVTDRLRSIDTARANGTLIDVNAIATAVVAALPADGGGTAPTLAQITEAFTAVINGTHLTAT
jgi:hypothetical protein